MSGPYWTKPWNPAQGCTPISPPEDLRARELAWRVPT